MPFSALFFAMAGGAAPRGSGRAAGALAVLGGGPKARARRGPGAAGPGVGAAGGRRAGCGTAGAARSEAVHEALESEPEESHVCRGPGGARAAAGPGRAAAAAPEAPARSSRGGGGGGGGGGSAGPRLSLAGRGWHPEPTGAHCLQAAAGAGACGPRPPPRPGPARLLGSPAAPPAAA